MHLLKRIVRALPLLLLSPFLVGVSALLLFATDVLWRIAGRRRRASTAGAGAVPDAASVVIPNWNGKDLLAKYLPSEVTAMAANPRNEVIVVDNGSSDGSVEFVKSNFPTVKVLALAENLGFGGGSNAGFRAAANRVVVLLNSDMRVDPGFLAPLLEGFRDLEVFAVSCQIFFSDPNKLREETGLTQGWWQDGGLRVSHRIDPVVNDLFPCFYGGGGSCAFDRDKFLELGGFDPLLAPFYLEDTDLGYMAWKRGWKVLYQPRSVVYHEHRGTIGKRFREERIQAVLKKNYLLFCWKNIHEWPRLASHLFFAWAGAFLTVAFGDVPLRPDPRALWTAFLHLPSAIRSRWSALTLAVVSDTEAFRRPMGGYFRDRFGEMEPAPERPRVLFVSPYPICPPVHGGGVFMYQTVRELARHLETHVVELLDYPAQAADNEQLRDFCASAEWIIRPQGPTRGMGSIVPYAVREVSNEDLDWLIHRQMFLKKIDVLQLEYTSMANFRGDYRRIATALFEHDVYFQSIARGIGRSPGVLAGIQARIEYLRALRFELQSLPEFDHVQVCTAANRNYLASYLPRSAGKIEAGLRAGIDASRYAFRDSGRLPFTMLFLGSFRHDPNRIALDWFLRHVLPLIVAREPRARLVVAGSDPPGQVERHVREAKIAEVGQHRLPMTD
jgi:GT2 family glycosyltransferase